MKVSHSLKRLLTSQTRQKLINILFYSPAELFYVRQLVRLTGEEINSVRRELQNLSDASIISSESRGNRLFYWSNAQHYLYYDLVIMANKHTGLGSKFQENRNKLGKLKSLLYSQNFLRHLPENKDNIDLLIIGEVSLKLTEELVKSEEAVLGRELNYMVMDRPELHLRLAKRDPVMVDFFLKYPAMVIGDPLDIFK
jgi:hypothetical protein